MLAINGIPTLEDLTKVTPPAERLAKGPCAIVECFQKIPCNPCATSCPTGAFNTGNDINELPALDHNKCIGCGICIARCPGLAIFILDLSGNEAILRLPFEQIPLPQEDMIVDGLGRDGSYICDVKVTRVQNSPSQDRTAIIWISLPKEQAMSVRNIRLKEAH